MKIWEHTYDIAVLEGLRLDHWTSVGVRVISMVGARSGLSVGCFGGPTQKVLGAMPDGATGGIVIVEDAQQRIHRVRARSVVFFRGKSELPMPFEGSTQSGMIPLSTANHLLSSSMLGWDPGVAILGTGNRALMFGVELLRRGIRNVFCVEPLGKWDAKNYAGWEVWRRQFEMQGGRILWAKPRSLKKKGSFLWELRVQDAEGVQVLEVSRVVSAGPFYPTQHYREFPSGSLLFEIEQSAPKVRRHDVQGWRLEEERARHVTTKIIRTIGDGGVERKSYIENQRRNAKIRLGRLTHHLRAPFEPGFEGKWIKIRDQKRIKQFSGVPSKVFESRRVASVECFEMLGCNLCESSCPEQAIKIAKNQAQVLVESKCTACGICVATCPSQTPVLVWDQVDRGKSEISFAPPAFKVSKGELVSLLNRRGEPLGSARVTGFQEFPDGTEPLIHVEVPGHLLWEARGIARLGTQVEEADPSRTAHDNKIEILVNGDKRRVRGQIPLGLALFEMGLERSEDRLLCRDGGCGLCAVDVDGVSKLSCRVATHPKMSVVVESKLGSSHESTAVLCPCENELLKDTTARMTEMIQPTASGAIAATRCGEGKCHGLACMDGFRHLMHELGIDMDRWIDWRFPVRDWNFGGQT